MIFTHIKDNPDGSADYLVDLTDEETSILVEQGIIAVIKASLRDLTKPTAWRVGEKVFTSESDARQYQHVFTHHAIIPLYE